MPESQQIPEDNTDLTNLLNELDNTSPGSIPVPDTPAAPPQNTAESTVGAKYFKKAKPTKLITEAESTKVGQADQPHEKQVIKIGINTVPDKPTPKGDGASNLADKIITNFGTIQSAAWELLEKDRTQIDQYISLFADRIHDPESTKTCYVEGLAALLNVKAGTSINATKMLDSIAKMVAAIKNMKMEGSSNTDLASLLGESDAGFDPENP